MKTALEILGVLAGLCTIALAVVVFAAFGNASSDDLPPQPAPFVVPIIIPGPLPSPAPNSRTPRKPFLPWRDVGAGTPAKGTLGGTISPDGKEVVMIDLPRQCRMKNVGGRDGAGLCVFTSINHMAFWQSVGWLQDLQKRMRAKPGGGYPEKVDRMLEEFYDGKIQGEYVQNTDCSLDFLRDVLETGRMPGITYNGVLDPNYGYKKISHMLNLIHLTGPSEAGLGWAAVFDNNFIDPEKQAVWMRPDALDWMLTDGHTRKGWAIVLLAPAPLPIPKNPANYEWIQE